MSISRSAIASPIIGLFSIAFTLAVWSWIWSRPPGTFHDQGGLAITLYYFPLAMGGWMLFGLPALVLGIIELLRRGAPEHSAVGKLAAITGIIVSVAALLMAVGTLVTA